jgi:hypothetical protein
MVSLGGPSCYLTQTDLSHKKTGIRGNIIRNDHQLQKKMGKIWQRLSYGNMQPAYGR